MTAPKNADAKPRPTDDRTESLRKVERQANEALSTAQDLAKTLDAVPHAWPFVAALRKAARGLEASAGATADLAGMALGAR